MLFAPWDGGEGDLSPTQMRKALEFACHVKGTRGIFLGIFADSLVLSRFVPFEELTAEKLGGLILAFAAAIAVESALFEDDGEKNGTNQAENIAPPDFGGLRV